MSKRTSIQPNVNAQQIVRLQSVSQSVIIGMCEISLRRLTKRFEQTINEMMHWRKRENSISADLTGLVPSYVPY